MEDPLRGDRVGPSPGDLAHGVDGAVVRGHVARRRLLRRRRRPRHPQHQRVQPLGVNSIEFQQTVQRDFQQSSI